MADMFKPHTVGCKVCKRIVLPRYGAPLALPEHDPEDVRYTHDYAPPTPLGDVIDALGDIAGTHACALGERNAGDGYHFKFGGILLRPSYYGGATRQFPLNKNGELDLDKIRTAIAEIERSYAAHLADLQRRNEMYDASSNIVRRLQERIGNHSWGVAITAGTSPSIVNLELRGLTEEQAIAVLRAAGYIEEEPAFSAM